MSMSAQNTLILDRLLSLPYRLLRFLIPSSESRELREDGPVVFIKLYGMGSLIRLQEVIEHYPFSPEERYLVTLPGLKPTAQWLGWQTIELSAQSLWQLPWAFFQTVQVIRRLKPRAIVDLERSSNGVGMLRLLSRRGAREISFRIDPKSAHQRDSSAISLFQKPVTQAIHEALKELGYSANQTPETDLSPSSDFLMVNVNASDYLPERKYPPQHFVEFIRKWVDTHPTTRVVLTGTASERNYVQHIADQLQNPLVENKAGEWSMDQFALELGRASLLVTNDSGPMHLAHYLGTPALVLWGPTHPEYVGYPDSDRLKNIWIQKKCSPCFEHPQSNIAVECQGRVDCLKEITPEQVFGAAQELWNPGIDRVVRYPVKMKGEVVR
jgi:ADP-heptose:LPS heptosyltransferase